MTEEKTKEILNQLRFYAHEVDCIKCQIENMRRTEMFDPTEHIAWLDARIKRLSAERLAASQAIPRLRSIKARIIFTSRYINGECWKKTASHLDGMTERNARIIHNANLPEISRLIEEELSCLN